MTQEYNVVQTWHHTLGDRRTAIAATLRDADGDPVDLTGCTVAFLLILGSDNTVKIDEVAATVDDEDAGGVSYTPSVADYVAITTAVDYFAWFVVTKTSTGLKDHYPCDGKRWRVTFHTAY